jgi:hypothetical protein
MYLKKKQAPWPRCICSLALMTTMTLGSITTASAEPLEKRRLTFTTVMYPTEWSEINTLLLVESIRAFAGALSQAPIWCFTPQYGKNLSAQIENRLSELDVTLIPFDVNREILGFFFAGDIMAAALAESTAASKTDLLIWLGSNTIVLNEPKAFLLCDNKNVGYRPVHHTNVGSPYDTPLDAFWKLIYQYCQVPEDRLFPMGTHIDGETIRPYFNAGFLVVRPEKKLFRNWHDLFFEVYQKPELQALYQQDERYVIFAHQAILSGVILAKFTREELQELPRTYNYPIHLFSEDVTDHRPAGLEEIIVARHEGFYQDPDWMEKIPAGERLKKWLAEKLPK